MSTNDWIPSPIQPSYYYVDYYEESEVEDAVEDCFEKLKMDDSDLILPLTLLSLVILSFTV